MKNQKTFVLVHGGWAGGWIWDKIRPFLEASGHIVYTPSLPGMAERSNELSPKIDLSFHISDVERLCLDKNLENIVLVANSYGGLVISGVADRLGGEKIDALIYLDALYLNDGETFVPPDEFAAIMIAEEINGTKCYLPAKAEVFGLDGPSADWVNNNFSPFPIACLDEIPKVSGIRDTVKTKAFIVAEKTGLPDFKSKVEHLRQNDDWNIFTIDSDHLPMVEKPEETAEIILSIIS